MKGRGNATAELAIRNLRSMLCLLALALPSLATQAQTITAEAADLDRLAPAGHGRVARVLSGHALELSDGRQIRLAGLLAPLPDPRDPEIDGLARLARAALMQLSDEAVLEIRLAATAPDRYGRLWAHLLRANDGLWLQAALLRAGHAQVFTTPETAAAAASLYLQEAEARHNGQGVWASAQYRPMPADAVTRRAGRYAIVRGRVREAAKVGGTLYLNFGEDWRRDFTLRLPWEARRRFPEPRREADWWTGRMLEMRGMLESYNGPMITASHPAEVRILETPAATKSQRPRSAADAPPS